MFIRTERGKNLTGSVLLSINRVIRKKEGVTRDEYFNEIFKLDFDLAENERGMPMRRKNSYLKPFVGTV